MFTEEGIPVSGDGAVLLLTPAGHRTVKYHQPPRNRGNFKFESGEHAAIGDSITLRFSTNDPGTPASDVALNLLNRLALTYGQIVALGGDFYGDPGRPIADGSSPEDRIARFTNDFNTLAMLPASKDEATQILAVMQTEIDAVNAAIAEGRDPHVAYEALGDSLSDRWAMIIGKRYLALAVSNWDHFGEWAVLAYKAGHAAALRQAIAAHAGGGRGALELAYAMNAFADHFLSDLFSAGHMRTPRKQLADHISALGLGSYVSSFLSRVMHDEDSKFGLNVTNGHHEIWRAYGDKRFFDTIDLTNRNHVKQAVQASADEIFDAFIRGGAPAPEDYVALNRIVNLSQVSDPSNRANYSPLFVAADNTVLRRTNVNDLNDRTWTKDWWGVTTMCELVGHKPNNPTGYLSPPNVPPIIQDDGWQSHTPVSPHWVDGNAVRYAFSYANVLNESYTGPWSHYVDLSGSYFPTLTVPVDRTGAASTRRIFRQFRDGAPMLVGTIGDTTTTFIDNTP
ncbi:MAG: hypothetical protein WCC64_19995 [Aliidongia sp.]